MNTFSKVLSAIAIIVLLGACVPGALPFQSTKVPAATKVIGPTPTRTVTPTIPPPTPTQPTGPTATPLPIPTAITGEIAPYPDAPLCPDTGAAHNPTLFHTIWDGIRGCHYDSEHGIYPFTQAARDALGGIDFRAFLGGVGVGHQNLSSPLENSLKHGGFKWQVSLELPQPCVGFESTQNGASAAVIQYHAFGDQAIEAEARIHTAVIFARLCNVSNPEEEGYIAIVTHQDYGQRVIPYIGTVVGYPNQPVPQFADPGSGPYFSNDCVDPTETVIQCRQSLGQVLSRCSVMPHHA